MKLSTTLLFTLRTDSKANQVKIHQGAGLHKQWTEKLILTSEMHNWNSNHPTSMILNFMEILLSYLYLYDYHFKMILQLTRPNHTKKASLARFG